jgi:hypothetical protein
MLLTKAPGEGGKETLANRFYLLSVPYSTPVLTLIGL